MHRTLEKIWKRGNIDINILKYFNAEEPKFGRFYLLPKIHKRLHNVPGRTFYTENISAFLDFQLKPIAAKIKSYIKDTNDFLRKLQNLPKVPDDAILCKIDVVRQYPNIPNDEDLLLLKIALDRLRNKTVSTESLIKQAELVLKNNYFEFNVGSENRKRVLL